MHLLSFSFGASVHLMCVQVCAFVRASKCGCSTRCDAIILSLQQMETMCFNGKGACPKTHAIISGKVTAHTWDNCHRSLGKKVKTEASTVQDNCFEYQKLRVP